MTVEKTKTKAITPTNHNRNKQRHNQSQFLAITCNQLQAREKSCAHGVIGFAFASHWLKNWRESFKAIIKRSNHNHVITFDSHLKTAVIKMYYIHNCHISFIPCRIKENKSFPSCSELVYSKVMHPLGAEALK